MDSFLNDIRYALRNLLKRPGLSLTLIATLTLALGIARQRWGWWH